MPYPPVDEMSAAAAARRESDREQTPARPEPHSAEERKFLLSVARQAIAAALEHRHFDAEPMTERLAEHAAVFTTLHVDGALRGCVGQVIAIESLTAAVAHTAVSAAFSDPRFAPLTAEELARAHIDLSVLTPLSPIRREQIVIGRHGLVISLGPYRGLLLPQVPVEQGWDVETFLAYTCMKAGLPPSSWQSPDAQLLAFEAEVFGE